MRAAFGSDRRTGALAYRDLERGVSFAMRGLSASLSCMDFGRFSCFRVRGVDGAHQTETALGFGLWLFLSGVAGVWGLVRCAKVRTSRIILRDVQLESLILAQNERWRQA